MQQHRHPDTNGRAVYGGNQGFGAGGDCGQKPDNGRHTVAAGSLGKILQVIPGGKVVFRTCDHEGAYRVGLGIVFQRVGHGGIHILRDGIAFFGSRDGHGRDPLVGV